MTWLKASVTCEIVPAMRTLVPIPVGGVIVAPPPSLTARLPWIHARVVGGDRQVGDDGHIAVGVRNGNDVAVADRENVGSIIRYRLGLLARCSREDR